MDDSHQRETINVLVGAVAGGNFPFLTWPSPAAGQRQLFADCVGTYNFCPGRSASPWSVSSA
jgi:hypothetical protein